MPISTSSITNKLVQICKNEGLVRFTSSTWAEESYISNINGKFELRNIRQDKKARLERELASYDVKWTQGRGSSYNATITIQ